MPCSCFGKKDKKAGGVAEDKYSRPHEQEPLAPSSQAPAQTQAPAPAQAEPTAATPPAPHTPPAGGDTRLRPEDDPDKASRRRDVVASFYSDQCELIGFKATGSRPPSAVVGGTGEGPAATSSPLSSPPSSSRSCATSRADLAMKRREFFKDLAVNDISSARYGTSQPTWKLVDSGSLTTPRRSHQQDSPQHHTLPFQARAGGLVLRPTSTPPATTPDQEPRITNGDSEHSHDQRTDDSKEPEDEPLLGSDLKQEPSTHHPQADAGLQEVPPPHHSGPDVEEPLLSGHQSAQDQSTPSTPTTPPATPATPPATPVVPPPEAEPFVAEVPTPSQPLSTEVYTEPAAAQSGGGGGECGQLTVQQQYVQQVSVGSDDERLAEGSCILIKEAFPEEPHDPRPHPDTPPPEVPDTTSASGSPSAPPATHEAARDVSQHSSEQPAAPPPTEGPGQRRASLPGAEEAAGERSPRHIGEAALDTDQHSRPTSSSGDSSAPGSPQQHRQLLVNEAPAAAAAAFQQQQDPPNHEQEAPGSPGETRPDVTIVGCIPKAAPSEEAHPHLPSPPTTPPAASPPSPPTTPAGEESRPHAPPTPPTVDDRAPPSPPTPPSLSEPGMTCGVDASSSPLEDDGLGSDIDDALSSLECLTEEELLNIMAGELAALVSRLETAVERLEKAGLGEKGGQGGAAAGAEEECTVPYVLAYDDLLSGPFKIFFDCSQKIGGDVATIAKLVQDCFINQRAFLVMASKSQRPLDTELPQVLEPTGKKIQEVIAFRESNRQSKFFNHLSAISESISGLSWVAVAPAPAPYVKEMGDSAMFYSNRVLKDYREKDKIHVEWVQNWNNVFKELQEYVRKYHTTGLAWNTRGGNAMNNLKAAPPNCGVPPPPPPGIPPPPPMVKLEPKAVAADDGRSALFASINKGTDITSGLKKVTDDMKTHKNPSLREGPKPFVKQSSPGTRASPVRDPFSGTPRMALQGKKWFVEYQKDNRNLVISDAKMDQSVYIFRCLNTVVQIKGKINSVILDSCKKSSVVFENLVSSAEVVNCQSCQVQVMGVMPTISIEKTDGCQVYLSKESLGTEIVTSKSSEMNVMVPKDDGDFAELPIPEQFLTKVKGLSLTTTCTESC